MYTHRPSHTCLPRAIINDCLNGGCIAFTFFKHCVFIASIQLTRHSRTLPVPLPKLTAFQIALGVTNITPLLKNIITLTLHRGYLFGLRHTVNTPLDAWIERLCLIPSRLNRHPVTSPNEKESIYPIMRHSL